MSNLTENSIPCLQYVRDGADFADKCAWVVCPTCEDRIKVDTVIHQNDVSYWYGDETIVMGRSGMSTRAFCSWKCAASTAKMHAKNEKRK